MWPAQFRTQCVSNYRFLSLFFFCHYESKQSSGYSQSASLLAHNRITAPQFIRRILHSSWYKQVPTHCLLLFAIEAGDLLDSVKIKFINSTTMLPSILQLSPDKIEFPLPCWTNADNLLLTILHSIKNGLQSEQLRIPCIPKLPSRKDSLL